MNFRVSIQNFRTRVKLVSLSFIYRFAYAKSYPKATPARYDKISVPNRSLGKIPLLIWMYWEDVELPRFVSLCVQKVRELNPAFEVLLLNASTLKEYLPDFTIKFQGLPLANKSDLIRLELLHRYGGIWIDATTIFFEDLNRFVSKSECTLYDCFALKREKSTIYDEFPVLESWFLASPPASPFIGAWLDILTPLGKIGPAAYFQKIKSRPDYKRILQNINMPEYLLVYLAQQIAMQDLKNFNISFQIAEEVGLFYQEAFGWNFRKFYDEIMFKNKAESTPPFIKLTSGGRGEIEMCLEMNLVNPNSLMGTLLND